MNPPTQPSHRRRTSRSRAVLLAAVLLAAAVPATLLAAAGSATATAPASPPASPPATVPPNSNATLETNYAAGVGHWATTQISGSPIHSGPSATAATIQTLHIFTSDGLPETYLVWAVEKVNGVKWVQIGVPELPDGVIGWVLAKDLGPLYKVNEVIVIDQAAKKLTLFRGGAAIFSAPVGVGKPSTPTPDGDFWVREKFPVIDDPFYGPFAIGTSDYSPSESDWLNAPGTGVIGIHGTDQPQFVPGDPSHGCVRMLDADITQLYKLVTVGALIVIKN